MVVVFFVCVVEDVTEVRLASGLKLEDSVGKIRGTARVRRIQRFIGEDKRKKPTSHFRIGCKFSLDLLVVRRHCPKELDGGRVLMVLLGIGGRHEGRGLVWRSCYRQCNIIFLQKCFVQINVLSREGNPSFNGVSFLLQGHKDRGSFHGLQVTVWVTYILT